MKILITNTALESWSGSELFARDVARGLRRRGHTPYLFSPRLGPLAEDMRREGLVVVDDLSVLAEPPDLIHGQHHAETMAAIAFFPAAAAVYFCHGTKPWEEFPPRHPRIWRYVAVSESVAEHMILRGGVLERDVDIVTNFVDTERFTPRSPLPPRPRRALVFSNYVTGFGFLSAVREACRRMDIAVDVVGSRVGRPVSNPEEMLGSYDVVFAIGRSALEAMAVGSAVILCNTEGIAGFVTTGDFERLRRGNFGRATLTQPATAERIGHALRQYDAGAAARVRDRVRAQATLELALDRVTAIYEGAIAAFPGPLPAEEERASLHRYHLWQARALERRRREQSAARRMKNAIRGVPGVLPLYRALHRAAHSFPRPPAARLPPSPSLPPPAAAAAGDAGLACVVMCYRGQPEVVDAVRSLETQDTPCEVVVVNSCGENPEPLIRAAGLSAPVLHSNERLLPGGARNVGVRATNAPYVAFLAADCIAEPGWVQARLARHRAGAAMVASSIVNANPGNAAALAAYMTLFARRMPRTPVSRALLYGVSYARALLEEVGLFREDLRGGEDTEHLLRAASLGSPLWAPEVRTAHRHPTTLAALARDQYARAARAARAYARINGIPAARRVARNALLRWPPMLWLGLRSMDRAAGWRLLPAIAIAPFAAMAYAWGAWRSNRHADPDAPPAAADAAHRAPKPGVVRTPRVYALCAFRNEARYLPGLLENLSGTVDGLLALDDGSTDGSAEIVAAHPLTVRLLRRPLRADGAWDEGGNQRALIEAAWETDADWLIAVDADERLETGFRDRARAAIAQARAKGYRAYWVHIRELWNQADTWRIDGIWGRKGHLRFFTSARDHEFDTREMHRHWGPINGRVNGQFVSADIAIYHLRMIREEDRNERRDRYMRLDPDRRWQSIGYEYLTDEEGLELLRLPEGRGYRPIMEDWPAQARQRSESDQSGGPMGRPAPVDPA